MQIGMWIHAWLNARGTANIPHKCHLTPAGLDLENVQKKRENGMKAHCQISVILNVLQHVLLIIY